jgi:hypothetical protein
VVISLGKKGFIENHKKNKFSCIRWTVQALGADGPWVIDFYLIPEFLGKSFRENALPSELSADPRRTVRYSLQNRVLLRGPGGRSAACPRTVRVAQADGPRGPGGRSARPNGQSPQPLTSHFYHWNSNADSPQGHRGQSVRYAFCP